MSRTRFSPDDLRAALQAHADPGTPALPATERARAARDRALTARRRAAAGLAGLAAAAVVGVVAVQSAPLQQSRPAPAPATRVTRVTQAIAAPPPVAHNGTLLTTLDGTGGEQVEGTVDVPAGTTTLTVVTTCSPTAPEGVNPMVGLSTPTGDGTSSIAGLWSCLESTRIVETVTGGKGSWWSPGQASVVTAGASDLPGPWQVAVYATDPRWESTRPVTFPKTVHGLTSSIAMDGGPGASADDVDMSGTMITVVLRCSGTGSLSALVDSQLVASLTCDGSIFDESVVDVPVGVAEPIMSVEPLHRLSSTWSGDLDTRTTVAFYWG